MSVNAFSAFSAFSACKIFLQKNNSNNNNKNKKFKTALINLIYITTSFFIVGTSRGLTKYIQIKVLTILSYTSFFKKQGTVRK